MSLKAPRPTSPATAVPAGVEIVGSQMRSTNLERDVKEPQLPDLYVGTRAQDALERFIGALEDPRRTRSWSLTGPYGSGKSTLALLIDALLGSDARRRERADKLVSTASDSLSKRLKAARDAKRARHGFLGAVATARREPLVTTLSRALRFAVERRWPKSKVPQRISMAMAALQSPDSGSPQVLDAVEALCSGEQPLLLIIDEFGKSLEHLATRGDLTDASDDLFLLQELAELGAGPSGLPLYIITLQHLSFLDYASQSATLQSREWAKIQGRFEDVTFGTHLGDAVQLLIRSLGRTGVSSEGRALIEKQATAAHALWADRGLEGVMAADAHLFADLYPLHPVTALAAPLLAAQIGQNDRSLAGFLSSDEPNTVQRFLDNHSSTDAARASTVRLPQLYDYFLASGRTTVLASANAGRWIEIDGRISEAHGLADEDQQILKTVGLLNLIDSSGALRASADMVLFALSDPTETLDDARRKAVLARLKQLEEDGFLVERKFSDEYRVWRGTDIKLQERIEQIISQCDDRAVVRLIASRLPAAVAAGRHSQRTGMLRHFITEVSAPGSTPPTTPDVEAAADGLLLFHLGSAKDVPKIGGPLPAAVGTTDQAPAVLEAGKHLLALEELLTDSSLDAVARGEVTERAGQAASKLAAVISEAFAPARSGTTWHLMSPKTGRDTLTRHETPLRARSLAGVVSAACEEIYNQTPEIRNEMLGRHQLTSQGAKARRELLIRMITHSAKQHLDIAGYGPDRAMYSGVLKYLGLHRLITEDTSSDGELVGYGFTPPTPEESLSPAWEALSEALSKAAKETGLDEIFRVVMAPPYGIKAGVVPIVVTTALLLRADDIAVFEEGTYRPRLTDDVVERLVKAPNRFTVKSTPSSRMQRKLVLEKLSRRLKTETTAARQGGRRNVALLTLTQALLDYVRVLTPYAKQTKDLSEHAIAVRSALLNARDPDALLFTSLPQALELAPIAAQTPRDEGTADQYVERLAAALNELIGATEAQRENVVATVADAFRLPHDLPTLRRDLAARSRGFANALLESDLKGLISIALNDALPDEDWLEPLVIRISGTALNNWTDTHAKAFPRQAQEMARSLDRVSHLYQAAHLDADAEGFEAQLVTVTDTNGNENRALVYVPDRARENAQRLADAFMEQAQAQLGPDGGRIVLAALTQSLLAPPTQSAQEAEPEQAPHSLKKVIS